MSHQSVPGLTTQESQEVVNRLEARLASCIDLQLTLKHIHWNVVGPNFIAVHEMLDEHVADVRAMTDAVAERMATLGGEPNGTPGHVTSVRTWSDYKVGRAGAIDHLQALDSVYTGIIEDHRSVIAAVRDIDPITEDLLIGQVAKLELFQWFVRAHLDNAGG